MNRIRVAILMLAILGFAGAAVALITILQIGDDFGYPGSLAYRRYELFNRSISLLLLLQGCSILAFALQFSAGLHRLGRLGLSLLLIAWPLMAVGVGAEFWLFSDLPYGEMNARSIAFSVFSLGSLLAGVGMLLLGADVIRSKALQRWLRIVLIGYLPFDIMLFIVGSSIFLAPSLASACVALAAIWPTTVSSSAG